MKRILEAFKISSYLAIKLEAALSSSRVRFNRICKNYALRILQISKNHPLRMRVSTSYSLYSSEIELDWDKYKDWNETEIINQNLRRKRKKLKIFIF